MSEVTFMPDDITVDVVDGENLLRAAMAADICITASCGGDGTCGKCRLLVKDGNVETKPSSHLTTEDIRTGTVLACLTTVTGDITVEIPPEARPGSVALPAQGRRTPNVLLSAEEQAERVPTTNSPAPVTARALSLSAPNLTDNTNDLGRVTGELRRSCGLKSVDVSLEAIRTLSDTIREGDWSLTAVVIGAGQSCPRIPEFRAGDTSARQFAIAVDVGTTTIELELVDLTSGEVLASASDYNGQIGRGEDVITRIIAASTEDGLEDLRRLVVRTISSLVDRVCSDAGVDSAELLHYVVAGNTVMTHLLLGISPATIRSEPYVPVASAFPFTSAREAGLPAGPGTQLITIPCPASWLGGDIVSGIVAAGIPWSDRMTLFVDIGTNGEIALGSKQWLVACSCSAGPAFEGGGIKHGMRASTGAVEQVRIDDETLEPMFLTIGGTKPLGICGSGLIDCVSELFLSGAIDRNGTFVRTDSDRIHDGEHGVYYVLVHAEETGIDRDIVLTENDIENLIRAKAAIHAGIGVMLESVDVKPEQIEEVVVAGGFGHYLDLERVMTLGMLPELPTECFRFIGNGSLAGAKLVVNSSAMLQTARAVAQMLTYIELSVNAGFMDEYGSSLFLPHTDLTLFPNAEHMRSERALAKAVK